MKKFALALAALVTIFTSTQAYAHKTIWNSNGTNFVVGTNGNDSRWATKRGSRIVALDGYDLLFGGPGDDILDGDYDYRYPFGCGNPGVGDCTTDLAGATFYNGAADYLEGGGGNDVLRGGPGDDTLKGEAGNDILWGGVSSYSIQSDNDRLDGGNGDDVLIYTIAPLYRPSHSPGLDTLTGGPGRDTFIIDKAPAGFLCCDSSSKNLLTITDYKLGQDVVQFRLGPTDRNPKFVFGVNEKGQKTLAVELTEYISEGNSYIKEGLPLAVFPNLRARDNVTINVVSTVNYGDYSPYSDFK